MKRLAFLLALTSSLAAWALDASLPDGSAGMGGADMTSEENDMGNPCLAAKDCDRGFACTNGRCVPAPIRNASGCGGGLAVSLAPIFFGLIVLRRR